MRAARPRDRIAPGTLVRRVGFAMHVRTDASLRRHLQHLRDFEAATGEQRDRSIQSRIQVVLDRSAERYGSDLGWDITPRTPLEERAPLGKHDLRRLAARASSRPHDHVVTTSGSTGLPLQLPRSAGERTRVRAQTLHHLGWFGYRPGDPYAYLGTSASRDRWRGMVTNETFIDADDGEGDFDNRAVAALTGRRFVVAVGFTSTFDRLVDALAVGPPPNQPRVGTVITIGEPLPDTSRDRIGVALPSSRWLAGRSTGCSGRGVEPCPPSRSRVRSVARPGSGGTSSNRRVTRPTGSCTSP